MNNHTLKSFLDELEKIALAGGVPKSAPPPKTSAPTPAPQARLAPTPAAKPPQMGQMRSASSVANRGAIRPGLSAAVDQGAKTMLGAQQRASAAMSSGIMATKQPAPPKPVTRVPQPKTVPLHSKIPRIAARVASPARRRQTAAQLGIPGPNPFY